MSVYVGIDVHRKRSQVAVIAGDGKSVMTSRDTGGKSTSASRDPRQPNPSRNPLPAHR